MRDRRNEAAWSDARGRWEIKVQRNGQRRAFYAAAPGKRGKLEAERKADAWIGGGLLADNVRFADLAAAWLATVSTANGTATKRTAKSLLDNWLLPRWGCRRVDTLTNADYDAAIAAAAAAGKAKSTCGKLRELIGRIARYARRARVDMEQPYDVAIPPDATPPTERRILQPDDLRVLLTAPDGCHYLHAFRLCVVLGLRRGELLGLQWRDLDGDRLTVRRSINNNREITHGKTANARRCILLPEIAQRILADQRAMLRGKAIVSPWVFPATNGGAACPYAVFLSWQAYQRRHGLPEITMHELRHTMISHAKDGLPLTALKAVVGHSAAMDTVGVYGHAVDGDDAATAAAIDGIFSAFAD